MNTPSSKKILVFRLSSLGDVLLSLAFLESLPAEIQVDWVIAKEFAFLLEHHPRIRKLYVFDKKKKLKAWLALLNETLAVQYDARVDLHVTLRSRWAKYFYFVKSFIGGHSIPWFEISKDRFRYFAYLIFKKMLPQSFRPIPFWKRFATLGFQVSQTLLPGAPEQFQPPSYQFVLNETIQMQVQEFLQNRGLRSKQFVCVMPASRWASKEWGVDPYFKVAQDLHASGKPIVLLGRSSDLACRSLADRLSQASIPYVSLLDEPSFAFTSGVLSQAYAYLGGDTGLAHLAEAVGTRSWVIFGPTRPDLGFGPWRPESVSIYSDVNCSPCSKDGRTCYRFWEPYACFKKLSPEAVKMVIKDGHLEGSSG